MTHTKQISEKFLFKARSRFMKEMIIRNQEDLRKMAELEKNCTIRIIELLGHPVES